MSKIINNLAFFIINLITYLLIILLFFLISYILYNSIFFKEKINTLFLDENNYFVPLEKDNKKIEVEFFVNKSIKANILTTQDIYKIYNKKISHWGSISDQAEDIISFAIDSKQDVSKLFIDIFINGNEFNKRYVKTLKSSEDMLDKLNSNKGSIGYIDKKSLKNIKLKQYTNIKPIKVQIYSVLTGNKTLIKDGNEITEPIKIKSIQELIRNKKNWVNIINKDIKTTILPYSYNKKELIKSLNNIEGSISIVPWHLLMNEPNLNFIKLEKTRLTTPLSFSFIFSTPRSSGQFGGISYIIINTFYVILLTAFISILIGVGTGIMLSEYAQNKTYYKLISISVETLSAIPAIIFGLFGLMFFVPIFGMGILSGAITSSLMILPMIIKTTEEAFKSIPKSYKYASYALGANETETIVKVLIPAASSGILTGIVLAIGRAIGETAILLFTMGTNLDLVQGLSDPARSLTVHLLLLFQEGHSNKAFATASVLIVIILTINLISKFLINKIYKVK